MHKGEESRKEEKCKVERSTAGMDLNDERKKNLTDFFAESSGIYSTLDSVSWFVDLVEMK